MTRMDDKLYISIAVCKKRGRFCRHWRLDFAPYFCSYIIFPSSVSKVGLMALPSFMESKHITLCLCMLSHSVASTLGDAMDHSPPGSSFLGKITGVIFSSRWSSQPWIEPASPASLALAGRFFTTEPPGKPLFGKPEIVFYFVYITSKMP